jgi:uncharacterized membrane protein
MTVTFWIDLFWIGLIFVGVGYGAYLERNK